MGTAFKKFQPLFVLLIGTASSLMALHVPGRFRIAASPAIGIDGSQETDGLAVDSRNFAPQFPRGILIVQDGYNVPVEEGQNFKIVDWPMLPPR